MSDKKKRPSLEERYPPPEHVVPRLRALDMDAVLRGATVRQDGARVDARSALRQAPESYQGQSLEVEWETEQGGEGLPWSMGTLRLEHKRELVPIYARGRAGNPGEYWKLRVMPQVKLALRAIIQIVTGAPWSLEAPELPEFLAEDATAQRELEQQWAWQQEVWHRWTQAGLHYDWTRWCEDVLRYSLICGFYLGEGVMDAEDGALYARLPALRNPATVSEWVFYRGEPIGVVQEVYSSRDNFGAANSASGKMNRVVIPWGKIVHVAHEPAGATDLEGQSMLRPAYSLLQMLQDFWQQQGLSAEVNALGTWVVTQDKERAFTTSDNAGNPGEKEILQQHFENYRADHVPWIIVPPGGNASLIRPKEAVVDMTAQVNLIERGAMMGMNALHTLIAVQQHGSFAARDSASADARDHLDYYAALVVRAAQQYLRKALAAAFPEHARQYVATPIYAQVEERDNKEYLLTLKEYYSYRSSIPPAHRELLDSLLDLPAETAEAAPEAEMPVEASPQQPERSAQREEPKRIPTQAMADNAERGLELGREFGRGGTDVGNARARDIKNRRPISDETLGRMVSYFARHAVDAEAEGSEENGFWGDPDNPSAGWIAWLKWGGDEGRDWAEREWEQLQAEKEQE